MKFPMQKDPTEGRGDPVAGSGLLLFRCNNCDGNTEIGWGKSMDKPFYDPAHLVSLFLNSDPRLMHRCTDGSVGICTLSGATQEKGPGKNEETH